MRSYRTRTTTRATGTSGRNVRERAAPGPFSAGPLSSMMLTRRCKDFYNASSEFRTSRVCFRVWCPTAEPNWWAQTTTNRKFGTRLKMRKRTLNGKFKSRLFPGCLDLDRFLLNVTSSDHLIIVTMRDVRFCRGTINGKFYLIATFFLKMNNRKQSSVATAQLKSDPPLLVVASIFL